MASLGRALSQAVCRVSQVSIRSRSLHMSRRMLAPEVQKPAPAFKAQVKVTKFSVYGQHKLTSAVLILNQAVVNGDFKEVSLDDYKGKYVVLFFYPLDFTFVCPTEIIAFSDAAAR